MRLSLCVRYIFPNGLKKTIFPVYLWVTLQTDCRFVRGVIRDRLNLGSYIFVVSACTLTNQVTCSDILPSYDDLPPGGVVGDPVAPLLPVDQLDLHPLQWGTHATWTRKTRVTFSVLDQDLDPSYFGFPKNYWSHGKYSLRKSDYKKMSYQRFLNYWISFWAVFLLFLYNLLAKYIMKIIYDQHSL